MTRSDGGAAGARVPSDGLSVDELSFSRGGARVLDRVGFDLPRGALCAVVGPSGAGKSTLLSLLAGFERPDDGSIRFGGVDWRRLGPIERGVGMSFDDGALHEHLTVRANLDSAAAPRGEPADRRGSRVAGVADALGIASLLDRKPATLSAGERRRVAVGRAFIRAPQLALLDEPFANLDRANRFTVRQMVRELQRTTGATTIVVTHDPTDALAIADRLLVLIDGRVRAFGEASEIAARPPDLEVAQLVDDLGMHAIELARDGTASDVLFAPAFAARVQRLLAAAKVPGPVRIGIRPAQIRVGEPRSPSIALDARVVAREPAGVFTDLIATRSDGRALRARVEKDCAQELPIGTVGRFHVHEDDLHLFAGPWPGVRID